MVHLLSHIEITGLKGEIFVVLSLETQCRECRPFTCGSKGIHEHSCGQRFTNLAEFMTVEANFPENVNYNDKIHPLSSTVSG